MAACAASSERTSTFTRGRVAAHSSGVRSAGGIPSIAAVCRKQCALASYSTACLPTLNGYGIAVPFHFRSIVGSSHLGISFITQRKENEMRILIVEDELDLANALARGLRREGYAVDIATTGEQGWELGEINEYDLVVLDLNLPEMDGLEVCRRLRESKPKLLILMLTARSRIRDRVIGLDLGADDYLVKPFHFEELAARIRALLRRDLRVREPVLCVDDLRLDPASHTVWQGKRRLELTHKEFGILEYLMRHPGEVISQEELIEHVWGEEVNLFTTSMRVHIHSLRRKLGDNVENPRYIETVVGRGYRLLTSGDDA
jgi:DNA-binding response OmpR family regulator